MIMSTISCILLALLVAVLAAWLLVHWRYHIQPTPLDSVDGLRAQLGRGHPLLVQFHAPL